MQQPATTAVADPRELTRVSEAPPLNLLAGTFFLLAIALIVWLLKRKNGASPEPERPQGKPFVIEHQEPACCSVAEAVRNYFDDPPLSVLTHFSSMIAQSQAFAQLRAELEADVDAKLEQRFNEHREETNRMLSAHREEVSKLLLSHVSQVSGAVASANQAHLQQVIAAIKAHH